MAERSEIHMVLRAAIVAAILLTGAAASLGAEYFVAPAGSDDASGVKDQPLRTLARALARAGPGDTVTLRAGVYREEITLHQTGLPGAALTIAAAAGEEVVFKGSDPVKAWIAVGDGVWKVSWPVNSQQLFCQGRPLQQIGAQSPFHRQMYEGHAVLPAVGTDFRDLRPGSFFYDSARHELYCMLNDRGNPNDQVMEASVRDSVLKGNSQSHITLRGLSFMSNNGTATGWSGLVWADNAATGWDIENCTFSYGDFAGLMLGGRNHIVRNSRFLNNGDEGIGLSGSDAAHGYNPYSDAPLQNILLENLTVTGNNYRHFDFSWHAGGMKIIPSCRGIMVRGCTVSNNWGPGIWFDTCLGGNVIEDNLVAGNNGAGIFYEISHPATGDTFGAIIRNNRVLRNKEQGIYISASEGAQIHHNTVVDNWAALVLHGMPRQKHALAHNVAHDNILRGEHADLVLYVALGADRDGLAHDNRVFGSFYARADGKVRVAAVNDAGYDVRHFDLKSLQERTGLEQDAAAGDAMFTDLAGNDLRVPSGSPARGKGWQAP